MKIVYVSLSHLGEVPARAEGASLTIPAVDSSRNDILAISRVISEEIMVQLQKDKLQQVTRVPTSRTKQFAAILVIIAFLSTLSWIIWKTYQVGNLGFTNKTLWDWMELLVVPFVLALLVFLLNKSQKDTEFKIAEIRRIEDRESAEQRANVDREIERDRQQQKSLEDYLDRMTNLLLENGLSKSSTSDEVRSIARTRTLTIIRSLDKTRKGQLIQFLYESSLIGKLSEHGLLDAVVDLSFADLSKLDLEFSNLSGINLSKTNLRNVNLNTTTLIGANFYDADLDDSDFSWSKLMGANLHAGLKRVNFYSANLDKANLKGAVLCGARLSHTSFKDANLQYANFKFKNKHLRDESNLEPATLMNVDFTGADLTKALIDTNQLRGARSLSGAIMPNGQVFEEWKKNHSLKDDINFEADTLHNLEDVFDIFRDENDISL